MGQKLNEVMSIKSSASPAPSTRYTFASEWDEVLYLRDKVVYWFYGKANKSRARPFAQRLEEVVQTLLPNDDAILLQECLALVYELQGDLRKAVLYREKEAAQIEKFFKSIGRRKKHFQSPEFTTYEDLADRYILIAMHHDNLGSLEDARQNLERAKQLARQKRFAFRHMKFLRRVEALIRAGGRGDAE